MTPPTRRSGLMATCALVCSCATAGLPAPGPTLAPGETLMVRNGEHSPDAAALLDTLYGADAFDPSALKASLDRALAAHPDDPDLHEAAAYLAVLTGDTEATELQFIRASLSDTGAAPLVYLRAFDLEHPLSLRAASVLATHASDPEVRDGARRILMETAYRQNDLDTLRRLRAELGLLDQWQVLGVFENDEGKGFNAKYAPEKAIDLTATVPGVLVPIQWRPLPAVAPYGEVRFESQMWPNRNAVAYALTYVTMARDQDAVLWFSTNSPLRVFVDGKIALSHETVIGGSADKFGLKVHLAQGNHSLLIKSANKSAHWYVATRLVTPDGEPIAGLRESSTPPPGALAEASFEEIPELHHLRGGLGERRAHFLASRLALRAGDPKLAVREAAAFHDAAKDNPLAIWALQGAATANDEAGKALDLLNGAVKKFGDTLPYFTLLRARAYVEKGLYEKAQADAESYLRLRPHDVEGELALAEIEGKRSFGVERCRLLDETVVDHPFELRALREAAACRAERGRLSEARAMLERARRQAPGDDDTLWALYDLARRAYDDRAAEQIQALRRARLPDWTSLWIESGELAERASQGAEAKAWAFYQHAIALCPDSPTPYLRLAELAYQAGDTAGATQLWSEASLRDPGNGLLAERIEHLNPTKLGFSEKFVPSDDAIETALADGAKRSPQDGSQTMMLLDDEVTEVHVDGSSTRVVTTVTRAVNDEGRDKLTQASVPTAGRFKILKAYAVSKDGERQEASSIRGGNLRFRNLGIGSTVVLQYVQFAPASPILHNEFLGDWFFQGVATEHDISHWTVVLPKARTLHFHIQGDVRHEQTTEGEWTVHQFAARDVPPLIEEPSSPPLYDVLRRVSVSTLDSWEDFARWDRALLADAFQESSDLGTLAAKLTEGAKTPRERLDKVVSYVAEQIRYQMDYENTIAGVRPHSSRQVLERGYADCKDKAVLLISLARELGIKLDYVVLRAGHQGKLDRDVPSDHFNHAIVYLPKQPGFAQLQFIDATTDGLDVGSLREDDQGAVSLVLDPLEKEGAQLIDIPYRSPLDEYEHSVVRIEVAADGKVRLQDRLEARGSQASQLRRYLKNPAYARKLDEQLATYLFPASTLLDASAGDPTDVWHPIWIGLDVDDSNALEVEGVTRRLHLPAALGLERLTSLSQRKTPLHLGVPSTDEQKLTVALPKGSKVVDLPKDFSEEAKCLAVSRKARQRGDQVEIEVKVTRSCTEVSPDEYPAFRAHLLRALSAMEQQLAFATSEKPGKVKKLAE